MTLPDTTVTGPVLVVDAREELARMEEAVAVLRRQVRSERRTETPSREELEISTAGARDELQTLETDLTRLRRLARQRKDEISEWKEWYAAQDVADVTTNLERLNAEIQWRAVEIAETEAEIQRLLGNISQAEGVVARLSAQIVALDSGAFAAPMREDPRLRAAELALAEARTRLQETEAEARSAGAARSQTAARFEIELSRDGQLFFNLKAPNGRVILTSGRHRQTPDLLDAVAEVRTCSRGGARIDRRRSRAGEPYFVVLSGDGTLLGRSEMYSSQRSMENGIRSVKANAPKASIRDLT